MKKLLTILLILIAFNSLGQIPKDKQLHFAAGAAISAGSYLGSRYILKQSHRKSIIISIASTVLIGAAKEIVYDKWMKKGTPEFKDFGYTVAGSIPVVIMVKIKLKKQLKISYD